jgi:hypothetical protein
MRQEDQLLLPDSVNRINAEAVREKIFPAAERINTYLRLQSRVYAGVTDYPRRTIPPSFLAAGAAPVSAGNESAAPTSASNPECRVPLVPAEISLTKKEWKSLHRGRQAKESSISKGVIQGIIDQVNSDVLRSLFPDPVFRYDPIPQEKPAETKVVCAVIGSPTVMRRALAKHFASPSKAKRNR